MRVKHAKKNVVYGIITYTILMLLTFINRKIFINLLGNDIAGLQGFLQNVLGFLNLIESGVGMAIMFSLYEPFAQDDKVQIKSILKLYSKIYKICGTVLFVVGLILSNYLGLFIHQQIDIRYVQICFILYIVDTVLNYYFSYKTCLLYASENGFIIFFWDFVFKSLRCILQIALLFIYKSFIVFIIIQLITNIGYLVIINYKVDKKFPWLKATKTEEVKGKVGIIKNIKALFIHKIGSFVIFSTDNILITYFIDLQTVAFFTNYDMVIRFCQSFINKIFDGLTASIGNLLTEKDEKKSFEVFKKLFFFNFWIASFVGISLYNAIDQFIILWLGDKFLLDRPVLIVLLINFYITTMRMCVDRFKESAGLYYEDRYAPLFEITINLVFSIILEKKMGLIGVFLGTLISNLSVIFWVKPKVLFNNVFKKSFWEYLFSYICYLCYAIIPFFVTRFICTSITIRNKFVSFIVNCILNIVIINLIYVLLFHRKKEFLYYKNLIIKRLGFRRFYF